MTQNIHADKILILDFGSQYTQLIARRVREIGVYCEILPWDINDSDVTEFAAKGIILSGVKPLPPHSNPFIKEQACRFPNGNNSILSAFSLSDQNLTMGEIHIFNGERYDFTDSHSCHVH